MNRISSIVGFKIKLLKRSSKAHCVSLRLAIYLNHDLREAGGELLILTINLEKSVSHFSGT